MKTDGDDSPAVGPSFSEPCIDVPTPLPPELVAPTIILTTVVVVVEMMMTVSVVAVIAAFDDNNNHAMPIAMPIVWPTCAPPS